MRNLIWLSLPFLLACVSSRPTLVEPLPLDDSSDSLFISLQANNMSEDMSVLSTRDDEIILLVYDISTSDTSLVMSVEHTFTSRLEKIIHPVNGADTLLKDWLIVLIEMDSDRQANQMEKFVTPNLKLLTKYFHSNSYSNISTILGSDDLLGIQQFPSNQDSITLSGVHRADMYEYVLTRFRH